MLCRPRISKLLVLVFAAFLVVSLYGSRIEVSLPEVSYGQVGDLNEINQRKALEAQRLARLEASPRNIIFVGDVLLARNVEHLMNIKGRSYPFEGLSFSEISKNKYVVGNFEAAVPAKHTQTPTNQIKFSVSENFLPPLKEAGFTHLSLANNHSYDFGHDGFLNTKTALDENRLVTFGSEVSLDYGSVTLLPIRDFNVALIGIHNLTDNFNDSDLNEVVDYAKQLSDFQVAYVHWGLEYSQKSSSKQRKLAEKLVRAGVDLIIGHHPHVVQEIDIIQGVPVLYSLGNYIFDQYFSDPVQSGLLIDLSFEEGVVVNLHPVSSTEKLSQPRLVRSEQRLEAFIDLAGISSPLLRDQILNGKITIESDFASSTKMAIIDE